MVAKYLFKWLGNTSFHIFLIFRRFKQDFWLKMSTELACTYAALILNDDGIDITADKISAILKVMITNRI